MNFIGPCSHTPGIFENGGFPTSSYHPHKHCFKKKPLLTGGKKMLSTNMWQYNIQCKAMLANQNLGEKHEVG